MPSLLKNFRKNRRGAVAAEFALLSIILLSLLTGSVEIIGFLMQSARMERAASNIGTLVAYMPATGTASGPYGTGPTGDTTSTTSKNDNYLEQYGVANAFNAIAQLPSSQYLLIITGISANGSAVATVNYQYKIGSLNVTSIVSATGSTGSTPRLPGHYAPVANEKIVTVELYWTVNFIGSNIMFTGSMSQRYTLRLRHAHPASCYEILQANSSAVSGVYVIGYAGVPMQVYCDMTGSSLSGTSDGGGWTLLMRAYGADTTGIPNWGTAATYATNPLSLTSPSPSQNTLFKYSDNIINSIGGNATASTGIYRALNDTDYSGVRYYAAHPYQHIVHVSVQGSTAYTSWQYSNISGTSVNALTHGGNECGVTDDNAAGYMYTITSYSCNFFAQYKFYRLVDW